MRELAAILIAPNSSRYMIKARSQTRAARVARLTLDATSYVLARGNNVAYRNENAAMIVYLKNKRPESSLPPSLPPSLPASPSPARKTFVRSGLTRLNQNYGDGGKRIM